MSGASEVDEDQMVGEEEHAEQKGGDAQQEDAEDDPDELFTTLADLMAEIISEGICGDQELLEVRKALDAADLDGDGVIDDYEACVSLKAAIAHLEKCIAEGRWSPIEAVGEGK